jgi:hypothetical protein
MTMKKLLKLFEADQVTEKAVSQQQQKFMGMVHAMQKGEKVKGASSELKKVAKNMGKQDAKDFAKTKHKDLPKRVTEDVMLDEGGNALRHITNRFKHEVKNFMNSGNMAENLYDALYDYYLDTGEMPYGIAKAREGDPYAWVEERFYADMGSDMSEASPMESTDTLSELARLAGLSESKLDECGDMGMDHEDSFNVSTNMSSDGTRSVNISAQGGKADELLQMLKMAGMRPHDDHSVTMSEPEVIMIGNDDEMMEGATVSYSLLVVDPETYDKKEIQISALTDNQAKEEAEQQGYKVLKVWDTFPGDTQDDLEEERETEYANTPEEEYQTVDSIIRQGNDLNREKRQYADKPRLGDNPMAESVLDEELSALLDSVLLHKEDAAQVGNNRFDLSKPLRFGPPDDITKREEPYKDPKTGKMITPPKGLSISEPVYPEVPAAKPKSVTAPGVKR